MLEAESLSNLELPLTLEAEGLQVNDTDEIIVVSDAGTFSCADVWFNVPAAWLPRVTIRLYARVGASRVLLRQVAMSTSPITTGVDGSRSGLAISVRGRPCNGLEVTCQATPGSALSGGNFYLQAWHSTVAPSSSGGGAVPEVRTSTPITAVTLLGRDATTGTLRPIAVDGSGRMVMHLAPPVPYDLTSLPNVRLVGIPESIGVPDGSPVSTWASEVGGISFEASGTDRPSYDADGLGGKPSVVWSGAHKLISESDLGSVIGPTSAYAAFVVKVTAVDSNEATNVHLNDPIFADAGGAFGLFLRSTPTVVAYALDSAIRKAERAIVVGQPALLTLRLEAGVLYVGVDGVETPGDTLTGPIGGLSGVLQLGFTTSNQYAGHIGKFVVCSAAPSAWTRSQVEASLKAEYGIP